jgi:hypothetical protein
VGTLRFQGWWSRSATAEAGGRSWAIARRGLFGRAAAATDSAGGEAGEFHPNAVRRGGELSWAGRPLALRPASIWRERYALADGDRELAVFDGKGWGGRPVKVTVDDLAALDPGLLLFAAYVVRGLADDGSAGAGVATTAATAG